MSIVLSCEISHINIRKRAGITPTSTVYMSHLIFIFDILDSLKILLVSGLLFLILIGEVL